MFNKRMKQMLKINTILYSHVQNLVQYSLSIVFFFLRKNYKNHLTVIVLVLGKYILRQIKTHIPFSLCRCLFNKTETKRKYMWTTLGTPLQDLRG